MTKPNLVWSMDIDNKPVSSGLTAYVRSITYNEVLDKMSKLSITLWNPPVVNNRETKDIFSRGRQVVVFAGWEKDRYLGAGIVDDHELSIREQELTITCYDKGRALGKDIHNAVFKNVKDSDIASKFAAQYSLTPSIEETGGKVNRVQSNKTDYRFLSNLAAANGYVFYVSFDVFKRNWFLHFEKPKYVAQASSTLYDYTSHDSVIDGFSPSVTGEVYKHCKLILNAFITDERKDVSLTEMCAGGGNTPEDISIEVLPPGRYQTVKEAQAYLKGVADIRNQIYMTASAEVLGDNSVKLGAICKWKGLTFMFYDKPLDGEYRIVEFTHTIQPPGKWKTSFKMTRTK